MPRVVFISDLHLYSNRSNAEIYWPAIDQAVERAEIVILGGDIFDFKWTKLASINGTVDAAAQWLERLARKHAHRRIHMLLGNHDHLQKLIQRLDALAEIETNLTWDPYYVRLDNCIFLHGDVANAKTDAEALKLLRARHLAPRKKGLAMNLLYDVAVAMRVHNVTVRVAHPHRRTAARIVHYLDSIDQGPQAGVQIVVFGHTHRVLTGYEYEGVRFYNCGAAIKGMEFRVVEVETGGGSE